MDRLHELIEVLSDKNVQARAYQAKRKRICKICLSPVNLFENRFSEVEYEISTICEKCQKYYYSNWN